MLEVKVTNLLSHQHMELVAKIVTGRKKSFNQPIGGRGQKEISIP
jgi:hypothetical protein